MLHSPEFWVAVGFVLLLAGVGAKIWKTLTKALDQRAAGIKARLDEAAKLRNDAHALLIDYQRKQRAALQEVDDIVSRAREEALRLKAEGEASLAHALKRREESAVEKIAQAEAEALAEVRAVAAELTVAATRELLVRKLDPSRVAALADRAIEDLPKHLA